MGHEIRGVSEAPALNDPESGSIGGYLARQRRLRGISLDDLAAATKIPRRSIERLEAGAFDAQPDGFARGFVRTIAEALGLDLEDTLNRQLGEPSGGDGDEARADRAGIQRWLWIAAVAPIAIALLFAAGWLWDRIDLPTASSDQPEIVYRRDAVRELALRHSELRSESDRRSTKGARTAPIRSLAQD